MSVKLLAGDCLEILPTLPDNTIDAVCCDPPYHLTTDKRGGSGDASIDLNTPHGRSRITVGFMNKEWDGGDIAFRPDVWRECLRVLKPGGYLTSFASCRGYHRMVCAIEDAGFIIHPMLAWIFGSGFPKACDAAKAIDRHLGTATGQWEGWAYGRQSLKPSLEPICLAQKPMIGTGAENLLEWGVGGIAVNRCRVLDGTRDKLRDRVTAIASCAAGTFYDSNAYTCHAPNVVAFQNMLRKQLSDVDVWRRSAGCGDDYDPNVSGLRGSLVDCRVCRHLGDVYLRLLAVADLASSPEPEYAHRHIRASMHVDDLALGSCDSHLNELLCHLSNWDSAIQSGRDSRAHVEALRHVVARYSESFRNLLRTEWKVQLNASLDDRLVRFVVPENHQTSSDASSSLFASLVINILVIPYLITNTVGLLLSHIESAGRWPANVILDGSHEVEAAFAAFGQSKSRTGSYRAPGKKAHGGKIAGGVDRSMMPDRDDWHQGYGDSGSPSRFFYAAKASKRERAGSKHPTIKPLALMEYLCKLICPPGGTILDPFAGSGTTGEAACNLGFNAILIERELQYVEDCRRRLALYLEDVP